MPTEANRGRAQQLLPGLEINVRALPCFVNFAPKSVTKDNEHIFEIPIFCWRDIKSMLRLYKAQQAITMVLTTFGMPIYGGDECIYTFECY